jgi:hypothetical protein
MESLISFWYSISFFRSRVVRWSFDSHRLVALS